MFVTLLLLTVSLLVGQGESVTWWIDRNAKFPKPNSRLPFAVLPYNVFLVCMANQHGSQSQWTLEIDHQDKASIRKVADGRYKTCFDLKISEEGLYRLSATEKGPGNKTETNGRDVFVKNELPDSIVLLTRQNLTIRRSYTGFVGRPIPIYLQHYENQDSEWTIISQSDGVSIGNLEKRVSDPSLGNNMADRFNVTSNQSGEGHEIHFRRRITGFLEDRPYANQIRIDVIDIFVSLSFYDGYKPTGE